VKRGRSVAFIGVDTNDNDAAATRFLERFPVSYPSYKDPDGKIAQLVGAVVAFPITAFYDSRGKIAFVHPGPFESEAQLAAAIDRYAR
jgi:hypothetical protein